MPRKDYVMIAKAISDSRARASVAGRKAIDEVAIALANAFEDDNPRFDALRFAEACDVNMAD